MAIICQSDETLDAAEQFAVFEGLNLEWQRIQNLEDLGSIENFDACVIEAEHASASMHMVQILRESRQSHVLPLIVLLPQLSAYQKVLCHDWDFVLPCLSPLSSHDFIPGLKKVVQLVRKKSKILKLRDDINLLIDEGRHLDALPLINKYGEATRDSFRSDLLRAKSFLAMRDLRQAHDAAVAAVQANKQSLAARSVLIQIYLDMGLPEKAQELVEKSLKLAPMHALFHAYDGHLAFVRGSLEAAHVSFEYSVGLDSRLQRGLMGWIAVKLLRGELQEASSRIALAGPELQRTIHLYSLSLGQLARWEEAEKLIMESLKLMINQKDVYKVWMNLGLQARKVNEWSKALHFFRLCVLVAPAGYDKVQSLIHDAEVHLRKHA